MLFRGFLRLRPACLHRCYDPRTSLGRHLSLLRRNRNCAPLWSAWLALLGGPAQEAPGLLETGYFGIKFCDYLFGSHTGSLSATTQRESPTRVECPFCFAERITFVSSRREQVTVPLVHLRNLPWPASSKTDSAPNALYRSFLIRRKALRISLLIPFYTSLIEHSSCFAHRPSKRAYD